MKRFVIAAVLLSLAGVASAQTPAPAEPSRGYVSVLGGGNFGNQSSGTFGGEVGYTVMPNIEVFGEAGRITNAATSGMQDSVGVVAKYLGTLGKGSASGSTQAPVNFGGAGLRYVVDLGTPFQPYVAFSVGVANVEKKPSFIVNGVDVTSSLASAPYNVNLGADVQSKANSLYFGVGGGVRARFGSRLMADAGVRYGRISNDGSPINTLRVYGGVGFCF